MFKWTFPVNLQVICMLDAMLVTACNFMAAKYILVSDLMVPVAFLFAPLTYVLGLLITQHYGHLEARKQIWRVVFFNILAALIVAVLLRLPAPDFATEQESALNYLFYGDAWLLLSRVLAFLLSKLVSIGLFLRLGLWTRGHYVKLRLMLTILVVATVDVVIFCTLAFLPLGSLAKVLSWVQTGWVMEVSLLFVWTLLVLPYFHGISWDAQTMQ